MKWLRDANYGQWRKGWVCKLLLGRGSYIGAGYIGGSTMFVAWRSGSLAWLGRHRKGANREMCSKPWRQGYFRIGSLEFGWTTNANIVPHTSH